MESSNYTVLPQTWAHGVTIGKIGLLVASIWIFEAHPAPIEAVSDSILGLVGVGNHSCVDMLNLGPPTWCRLLGSTVINMDVSSHS